MVSTPVAGEAGTGSCPCPTSRRTTLRPISPLPPMTTTFMTLLPVVVGDLQDLSRARGVHPSSPQSRPWAVARRRWLDLDLPRGIAAHAPGDRLARRR